MKIFENVLADKKMRLTFLLNRLVRENREEDSVKEQYLQADSAFY